MSLYALGNVPESSHDIPKSCESVTDLTISDREHAEKWNVLPCFERCTNTLYKQDLPARCQVLTRNTSRTPALFNVSEVSKVCPGCVQDGRPPVGSSPALDPIPGTASGSRRSRRGRAPADHSQCGNRSTAPPAQITTRTPAPAPCRAFPARAMSLDG